MGLVCCLSSYLSTALYVLKVIGFLKLLELLYRLYWTLKRQLRTTAHLTERYGAGSWAVVTGGSDGIGLAMCKELARRQFNVVIVARTVEKMWEAERQIKGVRQGCEVRKVEFDFTKVEGNHAVEAY
jgi:hypothetical protein